MINQFTNTTLLIALAAAVIFCALAWFKKWLDAGGALAAAIIGVIILLSGGWQLALPMLLFFMSGSLFGKLPAYSVIDSAKTKKPRDFVQVLSNGSIAAVCLLFYLFTKNQVFVTAYFLSIAICTSDTWSSELGLFFKGEVIDIISLKKIPKGLSGGISLMGMLAGLVGAALIALLYLLLFTNKWQTGLLITAGGFAGMLLDSLIGSWFQAVYRLENGVKAEEKVPGEAAVLEKGFGWMTNDLVNLLSNLIITVLWIWLMR